MAIMPGAEGAFVEERKARDYLLNLEHREGRSKAAFFIGLGFERDQWRTFAVALTALAHSAEAREVPAALGVLYVIDGPIETPSGRTPVVRTVWEVKEGGPPRLVTAYRGR